MYHPDFILHTEYLRPKYFYDVENGCIYWAIEQLYKQGVETIDAINITNMLNSNGAVKRTIEQYNLRDMQEFINMSQYAARHSLEEYKLLVKNVITASFKRDLAKATMQIQSMCVNSDMDLSKLNTEANNIVSDITDQYIVADEIELFGNKVKDLWNEIIERRTEDGLSGIPTKFPTLNEFVTFEPGELILLKARMKRGKSALFMNEAIHKIKNGIPTLYLDTEMGDRLFLQRMLANLTGIEGSRIKSGKYSHDESKLLGKAMDWLEKQPFVHMYLPITTEDEIYAIHKKLKYKMNLQFSIFDYIKSDIQSSSENYNFLGARCNFLKNNIAGDLDLALFTGAQLSRTMEVADSDKLERYVSASIMWQEKQHDEIQRDGLSCGNYKMTVNLNRLGAAMDDGEYIDMMFDADRMRIEEAKKHSPIPDSPFEEE